jgi:hypothetical protein
MMNGTCTSLAQSQSKHFWGGEREREQLLHTLQVSDPHGRKNHKREDNIRTIPRRRNGADVNKHNK